MKKLFMIVGISILLLAMSTPDLRAQTTAPTAKIRMQQTVDAIKNGMGSRKVTNPALPAQSECKSGDINNENVSEKDCPARSAPKEAGPLTPEIK